MFHTLDGKPISKVAHEKRFHDVVNQLDKQRSINVRDTLNQIIDNMPVDKKTGGRTFSSSFLGSELSPWQHPLSHLYDVAWEMEGETAPDEHVESQAALIFGQFIWECIMNREENWVFYDPNLNPNDPNREITGKVYFEQGS